MISGNGSQGLGIWHENSDGNVVVNNLVGLNPAGTSRLPNLKHGLDINYGSSANLCQGNVVSGNNGTGIEVSHTSATQDNQIIGNYIGTNVTGTSAPSGFGNRSAGINIHDGPRLNVVADNVIGNNNAGGIVIDVVGAASTQNSIHDNRIGISLNGSPIANQNSGIRIINGHQNLIGPGNIIAFNVGAGITIPHDDSDFNTLNQNSIYSNSGLGIDLFTAGVHPKEADDLTPAE